MENLKIPKWFWFVSIVFLLWNIMGVLSFFAHTFISDEALGLLSPEEQKLYGQYPPWTTVVFAVAVLSGLTGSLGMILKKKWSKRILVISIIAIIIQMSHNVFLTDSIQVYGLGQAITMPIVVVLTGIVMVWFSDSSIKKGWLQ